MQWGKSPKYQRAIVRSRFLLSNLIIQKAGQYSTGFPSHLLLSTLQFRSRRFKSNALIQLVGMFQQHFAHRNFQHTNTTVNSPGNTCGNGWINMAASLSSSFVFLEWDAHGSPKITDLPPVDCSLTDNLKFANIRGFFVDDESWALYSEPAIEWRRRRPLVLRGVGAS